MKTISKEVYTIKEVAQMLKVSQATIRRKIKTGDLPSSRVGTLYRIGEKDLYRYLEKTKTSATNKS